MHGVSKFWWGKVQKLLGMEDPWFESFLNMNSYVKLIFFMSEEFDWMEFNFCLC